MTSEERVDFSKYGKDFQVVFDSYNFLEWIDTEYIKEQLIKHIKTK